MNEIYIAVESSYGGPVYCYHYVGITPEMIDDCREDACENAFGEYEINSEIPSEELYKSISVIEVSTMRPTSSHYRILENLKKI